MKKERKKRLSKEKINLILDKYPNEPLLRKILSRVWLDKEKGCWFITEDWSVYTGINKQPGHRFIFQIFNPEESIKEKIICHKCDRPGCINPDHLFSGTSKDNTQDAIRKGRFNPKASRYMSKYWKESELDKMREDEHNKLILPTDYFRNAYLRKK